MTLDQIDAEITRWQKIRDENKRLHDLAERIGSYGHLWAYRGALQSNDAKLESLRRTREAHRQAAESREHFEL